MNIDIKRSKEEISNRKMTEKFNPQILNNVILYGSNSSSQGKLKKKHTYEYKSKYILSKACLEDTAKAGTQYQTHRDSVVREIKPDSAMSTKTDRAGL